MVVVSAREPVDYDPMLWGPPGWKFLHFISFAYPLTPTRRHKRQYSAFFASIESVLPCRTCRMHYQRSIRAAKRDDHGHFTFLESRDMLTRWLVDLHNAVNANKSKGPVDYETVQQQYETSANLCTSPTKTGSYTNLLESRGRVGEEKGEGDEGWEDGGVLPPVPVGGFTRQEMFVAAAVLGVVVVASAVTIRYTCASCAVTR